MNDALPLQGLKVLDLTNVIMGPFTTQLIGDFGADVIKIENPEGDMTRDIGVSRSEKMSSVFLGANRNKRSLVLNLKEKESKKALKQLGLDKSESSNHTIENLIREVLKILNE